MKPLFAWLSCQQRFILSFHLTSIKNLKIEATVDYIFQKKMHFGWLHGDPWLVEL